MQVEGQEYELQSAAQYFVTPRGLNEEIKTHEHSSATTRGGEYSGSALRGHWENTRTAYNDYYCDGCNQHHTHYRGDGGYGIYNNDGDYTGVKLDYYRCDSCGYNNDEANYVHNIYYHSDDGHGTYGSKGDYARAIINNYNDGSCGYTSYEEDYGCYHNTYGGGNHCKTKYGGYYNDYVGAKTGGHEMNYPPGGDEMCGIAEHTPNMATVLKENLKKRRSK